MLAPFALVARAALKGFVVFVGPMTCGGAVWAEMFNGFVVTPIGVSDAAVAIGRGIGFGGSSAGEEEKATENRGHRHGLRRKKSVTGEVA